MRYSLNILPACVVLSHLGGTTLTLPVLDGCPSDDSPSLVKRDAKAHVSIPHVVANFEPQPSGCPSPSPSSERGEKHIVSRNALIVGKTLKGRLAD